MKCVTENSNLIEIPTRLPIPVSYISIKKSFRFSDLEDVINHRKKNKLKWITNLTRFTTSNGDVLNPGQLMEIPKTSFCNKDKTYLDVILYPDKKSYRIDINTFGDFRICGSPTYSKKLSILEIMVEETIPFLIIFPDLTGITPLPNELEGISKQRLLVIKSNCFSLAVAAIEKENTYELHAFPTENVLIELLEPQGNIFSLNDDEMEAVEEIVSRNKMVEHTYLKFMYNELRFYQQLEKGALIRKRIKNKIYKHQENYYENGFEQVRKTRKNTFHEINRKIRSFANDPMRPRGYSSSYEPRNKFSTSFNSFDNQQSFHDEVDECRSRTQSLLGTNLHVRGLAQQNMSFENTRLSSFTKGVTVGKLRDPRPHILSRQNAFSNYGYEYFSNRQDLRQHSHCNVLNKFAQNTCEIIDEKGTKDSFETVYDIPNVHLPKNTCKSFKKVNVFPHEFFNEETVYTLMSSSVDNNGYMHEYAEIPKKLLS